MAASATQSTFSCLDVAQVSHDSLSIVLKLFSLSFDPSHLNRSLFSHLILSSIKLLIPHFSLLSLILHTKVHTIILVEILLILNKISLHFAYFVE